jgi:uncharacterized pyridoxamine 5'-phosphate oxidase family protein
MKRELSKEELLAFLRETAIMNISTILEGKPISSVVGFAVKDDFVFTFVTGRESYKARSLFENPSIAFSVWKRDGMFVQGTGQASVLSSEEHFSAFMEVAESVVKLKGFWPPIFSTGHGDYAVFTIKPSWIRMLNLSDLTVSAEDSPFTEFNF